MDKPIIGAAERNKKYILECLKDVLFECTSVLEIGSGTGQHAVYFAPALRHLKWQPSDLSVNLKTISAWCADYPAINLLPPVEIDIRNWLEPEEKYDAIFASNVIHYIENKYVEGFFAMSKRVLSMPGILVLYGPFKQGNQYSSEGDTNLDLMLKSENKSFGIRNIEDLIYLASKFDFVFGGKINLPANNKLIYWITEY